MEFTPERISELRELASKATPRPWAMCGCGKCEHVDSIPADCSVFIGDMHVKSAEDEGAPYAKNTRDNTVFIVAAVNELPAALDEIERLNNVIESLRDYRDDPSGILRILHNLDVEYLKTSRADSKFLRDEIKRLNNELKVPATFKRCPRCFESALDASWNYCPRCGEKLEGV